ncbi:hypothetical protein RCJ22_03490, partial [Vibrio sp. FNV 38]|nr:hypothetical protein [Vibrio sp. FNV 38]
GHYDLEAIIKHLTAFDGHVIIQTMFLGGKDSEGVNVQNTSTHFVDPWLKALQRIRPEKVMIYTIDRETPVRSLKKATPAVLDKIAERVRALGIECSVAY